MAAQTLGKYRLLRCIGVGGMAEVYEARRADDPTAEERLAVKVLLPQHVHEMDIVRSFIDEATIAASLSHPNVVGVLDYGCAGDQYFIAMEHVDGWDLHELIECCATLERPMPVGAAAYLIHELSQALEYIHTRQFEIVHRDVTPHNVFVDRAGRVKLGDFGVAKTAVRWSQTHTGLIKGKLGYLAPEQVRGEPVSKRTDIYSSGLILYELLTCQRYNRSSTQSGLLTRAHDPVVALPSELNPGAAPLDEVIRGALQHDPVMRTRDAALLAEQTRGVLERHPFAAADMARLAEMLHREARAERTIPNRHPELRPELRPQPIEGVASGELVLEETLRTGAPDSFDGGLEPDPALPGSDLEPQAALGVPGADELDLEETVRTDGPPASVQAPDPAVAVLVPEAAAPAESAAPTDPDRVLPEAAAAAPLQPEPSYRSSATTMPGPESGLIQLLHEPADRPLQATPTTAENLPAPPAERRMGWGWIAAGVVVLAAAGVFLLRWTVVTSQESTPPAPSAKAAPDLPRHTPATQPASSRPARPTDAAGEASEPGATGPADQQTLDRVLERARQRGLWPGDLPELDRLRGEAQWALRNQRSARWELERLARLVRRFRVTPAFVRRKLDHLERSIGRRGRAERRRRRGSLRELGQMIAQGQLLKASRRISLIAEELEHP